MAAQLVVIGGGRMGEALVGGLIASSWAPAAAITVVERVPARRDELARRWAGVVVSSEVPDAAGAVIAVKPGDVETACAEVAAIGIDRVLSIAAGVRIGQLEEWLAAAAPAVLRAMPNTPALIGAGASALSAGTTADADDVAWGTDILAAVGTVTVVPEPQLDAVTGLSGSGPAYLFLVAEALVDAGVLVGLPRPTASELVVQTLLGAARMLAETGDTPQALRAAVTSPAGTTAAGLRAMEQAGVRAGLIDAVVDATRRSKELAGEEPR
jgi:pyrroline-5-carboxylate reductase